MDTTQQLTWPPPPDIPDPLAAHDAFLTTAILAPVTKPPLSRLRLALALRKGSGLNSSQCLAIVNGYCDRQGVFPPMRGIRLLLPFLLPLAAGYGIAFGTAVTIIVKYHHLYRPSGAAFTRAAGDAFIREAVSLGEVAIVSMLILATVITLTSVRRTRREAEDARRKVGSQLDSGTTP